MGRAATDMTADGKIELQRLSRETSGERRRGWEGDTDLLTPSRANAASSSGDGGPSQEFSARGLSSWLQGMLSAHLAWALALATQFPASLSNTLVFLWFSCCGDHALFGFLFPLLSNPSWEQSGFGFSC